MSEETYRGLTKEQADFLVYKLSDEGEEGVYQRCSGDSDELDSLLDGYEDACSRLRDYVRDVAEHFGVDGNGQ